ncbi:MAG TPA: D-2-hydroxyacid dehydrogenase [Candidatus Binatia bacterium]|nr:D-2-hydroxyacid dehydrogenase [Candidatus Binatia bacterium]
MKVAAGRSFFAHVHEEAKEIVPDLRWTLIAADGSWSESPEDCDLVVLAGDAYTSAFVETVLQLPAICWAHTEDAGTDGRFYDAMRAKGVTVTHCPGANAAEVAEFAIGCMLWSAKRLGEFRDNQRAHRWQLLALDSLSDKTVLVVGLGAIGTRVTALAKAFGMRVLGIRRSAAAVAHLDEQGTLADLPRFLPAADFIVLALPFTEEHRGLIGKSALAVTKKTVTLINVARGAIVDVAALKEALQTGRLRQACLDVLPIEPWPAEDDLWDTPRLLLTPHNAWSSPLYLPRVAQLWLENLRRYVRGEDLLHKIL